MHSVRGPVLEEMIAKIAQAQSAPVGALKPADIQKTLAVSHQRASLFAIRCAQEHLTQARASSQEDLGLSALSAQGAKVDKAPVSTAPSAVSGGTAFSALMAAKSGRDVVVLGPLPKLDPARLGEDLAMAAGKAILAPKLAPPPLAPEARAALWGLDGVRAAARMPRAAWLEHVSKGMGDPSAFAAQRYGAKGAAMLSDLNRLNEAFGSTVKGDFTRLLVDPGLMSATHRGAFTAFALEHKGELAGKTPFQIRQAYADTLTPKTYYRALKLPDSAAETIATTRGMASRVARSLDDYPDLERRLAARDKTAVDTRELADTPLATALSHHIRPFSRTSEMRAWTVLSPALRAPWLKRAADELGLDVASKDKGAPGKIAQLASKRYNDARARDLTRLKDGDALLSVSEDRRVALSVAADPTMAGSLKPGESIYLYQLKLCPLDVIDPADYVGHGESPSHVKFGSGPSEAYSARVEGIVLPHIHPSEITGLEKLDVAACRQYKMELEWR